MVRSETSRSKRRRRKVISDGEPGRLGVGLPGSTGPARDSHASLASATARIHDSAGRDSRPAAFPLSAGVVVEPLATYIRAEAHPLLAIVGPTASGKSELAVRLALDFGGEVINFDSVQVYRGFDIGAGKLSVRQRKGVRHHLIDVAEPEDTFTAGDYRREALKVLEDVRRRGKLPILVGGTGLYLRALLLGLFEGPPRSEQLRQRLGRMAGRRGREFLHRLLVRKDPRTAARIHARDTQKTIRALEVCFLAHRPFSELLGRGRETLSGFRVSKIGLRPPRAELAERIERRAEAMFVGGIIEEVRAALARAPGKPVGPLGALGYRQARSYVEKERTLEEAVRDTQAETRRYAKRQMTWFRREPEVRWFDGFGDDPAIEEQVFDWLTKALGEARERIRPASSLLQSSGI